MKFSLTSDMTYDRIEAVCEEKENENKIKILFFR